MANEAKMTELIAYMRTHIDKWNQAEWAAQTECGTTFCAAGFRAEQLGYQPVFVSLFWDESEKMGVIARFTKNDMSTTAYEVAKNDLELTEREAHALFLASSSMVDIDEFETLAMAIANDKLDYWVKNTPSPDFNAVAQEFFEEI